MRNASMEDITKFLDCRRVALVGVSRDSRHFSRALFREFLSQGYDAVPVNPQAAEIEGRKSFPRLSAITPPVAAALLMTGSEATTDQQVGECNAAGIQNVWIYKSHPPCAQHEQALEASRAHGGTVVEGYCPFMFLPRPSLVHRVHGFFMKVTGHYPL